jgi:hypothetical protein
MILIGDKDIDSYDMYKITCQEEIDNTPSNSIVLFDFDIEIMKYCETNSVQYCVIVHNITQAIYANCLLAKYIITPKSIAKAIQEVATNYMFDSRILAIINNQSEIEEIALQNIDGVIYDTLL